MEVRITSAFIPAFLASWSDILNVYVCKILMVLNDENLPFSQWSCYDSVAIPPSLCIITDSLVPVMVGTLDNLFLSGPVKWGMRCSDRGGWG